MIVTSPEEAIVISFSFAVVHGQLLEPDKLTGVVSTSPVVGLIKKISRALFLKQKIYCSSSEKINGSMRISNSFAGVTVSLN